MKSIDEMTKAELIESLTTKVQKASPLVKKVFLRNLQYRTKTQLREWLKKAKVTRGGDIHLV